MNFLSNDAASGPSNTEQTLISFPLQSVCLLPTAIDGTLVDNPESRDFAPETKKNHIELKEQTKS